MSYVLFISEAKLKDSTAINLNVDVDLLLPYLRQSQKLYVETHLGTPLNDYIGDMLPNWALYHCIPFLRFKVENGNIYSKTSETGNAMSVEESQHLREEIRNTAEYYTERMIDYLCNNNTLFPEYGTASGSDVNADRNAYYNGMNLERPQEQGTRLTLQNFLSSSDYS
jgi:hypothetical protein